MKRLGSVMGVSPIRSRWAPRVALVMVVAIVALAALVAGCNDYGNTFQSPTGAAVSTLAPSNATAGGPAFTLTVIGSGFVAKTVVQWNGKSIATQVLMDTSGNVTGVTASVTADLISKPGTAFVNTLSPFSGAGNNGLSNTIAFLINPTANPVPAITSISPNTAAAGSASFTLTVNGSNFLPTSDPTGGSQVNWNLGPTQSTLPIVSISSTQIKATVPSTLLVNTTASPVSAVVTVYNPPAPPVSTGNVSGPSSGGGGTSPNGLSFSITPAGTASAAASQTVSEDTPAVSVDGRYVAFTAAQEDHTQIFVRDTCEGATASCQQHTALLSAAADGTAGNDDSHAPSMSSDGRYIAFSSAATNLVASTSTGRQIYLRDTCAGATAGACTPSTQLISTDTNGALVGTESILPSVSASGRYIAFLAVTPSHVSAPASAQAKSAAAATSAYRQVFVRDTCLGATGCTPKTRRVSLQPGDAATPDAKPAGPALAGGASHVAVAGTNAPTLFTRSVAVDDRVFLAVLANKQ